MKHKIIMLVNSEGDSVGVVTEAAARNGYGVRVARSSRDAFAALKTDFDKVDALLVDLDSGGHGFALLEAVNMRKGKPLLLALTSCEELDMKPVAFRHGAQDCFGKPLSLRRITAALAKTRSHAEPRLSCDSWGHLRYEEADKV
jgi:DNA-binding response OmpR family regulator